MSEMQAALERLEAARNDVFRAKDNQAEARKMRQVADAAFFEAWKAVSMVAIAAVSRGKREGSA